MNLHYICRGNVLRSLIAENYTNSLGLPDITAISSGTNVNWSIADERIFFASTVDLLKLHGISGGIKDQPDQLVQSRLAEGDQVVFLNQRVYDAAARIVSLPQNVIVWDVTDIGEGHRTDVANTRTYEEEIFTEVKERVDALLGDFQSPTTH